MMKWLLDVNVNRKIIPILKASGIESHSAVNLGWRLLTNGDLISAAVTGGFNVMLTNDVRIMQIGNKSLSNCLDFSIVLLRLPQIPSEKYLQAFEAKWLAAPIEPQRGRLLIWPD